MKCLNMLKIMLVTLNTGCMVKVSAVVIKYQLIVGYKHLNSYFEFNYRLSPQTMNQTIWDVVWIFIIVVWVSEWNMLYDSVSDIDGKIAKLYTLMKLLLRNTERSANYKNKSKNYTGTKRSAM